jgi:hypothetical protein
MLSCRRSIYALILSGLARLRFHTDAGEYGMLLAALGAGLLARHSRCHRPSAPSDALIPRTRRRSDDYPTQNQPTPPDNRSAV